MSAPKPLRATSLRDSLTKTVRLLTKQGIQVQFRGYQPHVLSRGGKVVKLVLPEVNDSAPPSLIEAIQGFLDHEVGHIFYTDFVDMERFGAGNRVRHAIANIIEDIRLEKLLPRDLPGTKENLERMYESVMDEFFGPAAISAKDPKLSKSDKFSCVMVVAMRALAGQKAFQRFMDDNDLWPHFMPLVNKMPNISRRLRDLETYKDVLKLTEDIIEAMKPPEPKEDDASDGEKSDEASIDPNQGADGDEDDDAEDSDGDDAGDDTGNDGDEDEDGSEEGEETGGEGHGDGEGTDDEEGDEDDTGSCGGDEDEDGDDEGDGDAPADSDEPDREGKKSGKDGRENRSLRDALAMLEPAQRRALFLYNKRSKSVAEIAEDMSKTEDETVDLLAQARKKLRELLNGG